eukprot:1446825-Rhodomonas_salina.5
MTVFFSSSFEQHNLRQHRTAQSACVGTADIAKQMHRSNGQRKAKVCRAKPQAAVASHPRHACVLRPWEHHPPACQYLGMWRNREGWAGMGCAGHAKNDIDRGTDRVGRQIPGLVQRVDVQREGIHVALPTLVAQCQMSVPRIAQHPSYHMLHTAVCMARSGLCSALHVIEHGALRCVTWMCNLLISFDHR